MGAGQGGREEIGHVYSVHEGSSVSFEQNELCWSRITGGRCGHHLSATVVSESSVTSRIWLPPDPHLTSPGPSLILAQTIALQIRVPITETSSPTNNTECEACARPHAGGWAFSGVESSQEAISSLLQKCCCPTLQPGPVSRDCN